MLIFTDHPVPPQVYGLYTHENVDIYGRPLNSINKWLFSITINSSNRDSYIDTVDGVDDIQHCII